MPPGQIALDLRLALGEPVKRSMQGVSGGVAQVEEGCEGGLPAGAEFAFDAR